MRPIVPALTRSSVLTVGGSLVTRRAAICLTSWACLRTRASRSAGSRCPVALVVLLPQGQLREVARRLGAAIHTLQKQHLIRGRRPQASDQRILAAYRRLLG